MIKRKILKHLRKLVEKEYLERKYRIELSDEELHTRPDRAFPARLPDVAPATPATTEQVAA